MPHTRHLAFLDPRSGTISSFLLMTALAFFAFTTILGWAYYSEKCLEYVFNGLMAFPNLVALLFLSPVVARTTFDFLRRKGRAEAPPAV